ncbi:MAG: glycosyltransferase family 2 protein, partial [Bryobacteraceae bacterium]
MIAIAIVTYNSAAFIRRCLEYVFEQDYTPFEIIVVDNASKDGTPEILGEFEQRIRVAYNQENTG